MTDYYPRTDLGNSALLVALHGRDLRYCSTWDAWLVWDGRRWARDDTGEAWRHAEDAVLELGRQAAALSIGPERDRAFKFALRSQQVGRIQAILTMAQRHGDIAVRPGLFDSKPYLLNCENGTVNLRTGKLMAHRRSHYLTKLAPVAYDPDATCPKFRKFLYRIMAGDKEQIAYLQRAIGYSLTGDVSEQVLFFAHGVGANGKSTLLGILQDMLGGYAIQSAPELLVTKSRAHPTEIADLAGTRLVATIEVEQGKHFAEAQVKQMTGGDRMRTRRMHENFWEFAPTHKIWLAANHKPVIVGTDHAMWRRIKPIPFDVIIPDAEQDKHLPEKLREELSGILTWAVEGCLEWQRDGLREPAKVTAATAAYRAEMDVLGNFLADYFVIDPSGQEPVKDVNKAYAAWCRENGEVAFAPRVLKAKLESRGYKQTRSKHLRQYTGIRFQDGVNLDALLDNVDLPEGTGRKGDR